MKHTQTIKRKRTGKMDRAPLKDQAVRLGKGLRSAMGGRKFCNEEELTRDVLFSYLKAEGEIKDVKLVKVAVQGMDGTHFHVVLEKGGMNSCVRALKLGIEEVKGTPRCRQELFALGGSLIRENCNEPLRDDSVVTNACTVALCVKPTAEWEWHTGSEMIKDEFYELKGPGNARAVMKYDDAGCANIMAAGPVMLEGSGKHTISFKLQSTDKRGLEMCCGVVRSGVPCKEYPFPQEDETTTSWLMHCANGGLFGNGKWASHEVGRIAPGNILTMQLDSNKGTLRFWVDGKVHGPGWTSGLSGDLCWAINCRYQGDSAEIVPAPKLEKYSTIYLGPGASRPGC